MNDTQRQAKLLREKVDALGGQEALLYESAVSIAVLQSMPEFAGTMDVEYLKTLLEVAKEATGREGVKKASGQSLTEIVRLGLNNRTLTAQRLRSNGTWRDEQEPEYWDGYVKSCEDAEKMFCTLTSIGESDELVSEHQPKVTHTTDTVRMRQVVRSFRERAMDGKFAYVDACQVFLMCADAVESNLGPLTAALGEEPTDD